MVSYVVMQDRTFLGNAAIVGSVYGCIAENNQYAATPCCENASQIWLLKGSVKKMKIVISSSIVIVLCAKQVRMATSQPCGIRRVQLRSSDRRTCSLNPDWRPALLPLDNLVGSSGFVQCADV